MPKPRNLTAAAYHRDIANPPAAHIKDSVSNTAPGLELDERTIEKHVFPGLVLEFQRSNRDETSGNLPVVRTIDQDRTVTVEPVAGVYTFPPDLPPKDYVFVYAVRSLDGPSPQTYRFDKFRKHDSQGGPRGNAIPLDCWNAIRNLTCPVGGRIALLIGRGGLRRKAEWATALDAFNALSTRNAVTQQFPAKPNPLLWAVVVAKRPPLEEEATGLLFPNVPPGDLQSTMCTPWHYDFRDCHCYYWASSRPDMVSGEGPEERNVHFMRKRKPIWDKVPIPPQVWAPDPDDPKQKGDVARQRQALWDHVETINDWETLPVVLNDTEVRSRYGKVVEKLQVLAGIEHALAVEYLYAYQSVDPAFGKDDHRLGEQARDVLLRIATDEMHHFRWVNEVLELLTEQLGTAKIKALTGSGGQTMTIIDRAENYGPNFDWRSFALRPLDRDTLDWFIRIERPSRQQHADEQLEGLYISVAKGIQEELEENGEDCAFGNAATVQKIQGLIKLIIEEGDGHYRQLAELKHRLFDGVDHVRHLRQRKSDPGSAQIELARQMSDACYHALLFGLGKMFMRGDDEDGRRLQRLVTLMKQMDRLNDCLAQLGYPAKFTPPDVSRAQDWGPWLDELSAHIRDLQDGLKTTEELHRRAGNALATAAECCRHP
jgi:hypothetical protein